MPDMARYFIERTPDSTGPIYEVYSEERALTLKVTADRLPPAGWNLKYTSPEGCLVTSMAQDSLKFSLQNDRGRICGYIREADFSVMGKSIVEDESHHVVGFIKSGVRPKMRVYSSKEEILAEVSRDREKKVPVFLWPSKAHLARQYVLQTASETHLDDRLFFCVICLLVAEEWQSSGS
jgi:hypothetical protein